MSWEKVRLGKYLKVRDTRFKPADKAITALKRIEKIDFSGEIFLSNKPSNTDMILVKKGDLVISGINVEKGAMAVYSGHEDITATIHYSAYSYDEKEIDIDFLKSFLKSSAFKNALKEQVPGGIKTEIKPKHLLPLLVTFPTDINDQRAVVKLLKERNSKIDSVSTELSHQLAFVKKLRQQILQDAVQGKLVPQDPGDEAAGELLRKIKAEKAKLVVEKKLKKEKVQPAIKPEEIPFEIPDGWVWCRLEEITESSFYGPRFSNSDYVSNGIPTIRTTDMTDNGEIILKDTPYINIVDKAKIELYKVLDGDLLVTRSGSIGIMAIFRGGYLAIPSAYLIRFRFMSVLPEYIFNLLKSPLWQTMMGLNSRATAQVNINATNILLFPIPLPPLPEQYRIVQKLNELMQTCDALEASIQQSVSLNEKLLQGVLREALRGG